MRVLVCGGRDFADRTLVRATLRALHDGPRGPIAGIFHGNARGADTLAGEWASQHARNWPCPAQWSKYGKKAGPIRNQQMLGQRPDLVIAFPGGRGTADMIRRAEAAGIEVVRPLPLSKMEG